MTAPRARVVSLCLGLLALFASCDDADGAPTADGATTDMVVADSASSVDATAADATADLAPGDATAVDLVIKRDFRLEAGPRPDAETTPCGLLPCDNVTQVCVNVQIGGPERPSCKALPQGCSDDRSCSCFGSDFCEAAGAICGGRDPSCVDGAPDDNRISCICPGQR